MTRRLLWAWHGGKGPFCNRLAIAARRMPGSSCIWQAFQCLLTGSHERSLCACNESRCHPPYCANHAPRDQEARSREQSKRKSMRTVQVSGKAPVVPCHKRTAYQFSLRHTSSTDRKFLLDHRCSSSQIMKIRSRMRKGIYHHLNLSSSFLDFEIESSPRAFFTGFSTVGVSAWEYANHHSIQSLPRPLFQ